MIYPPIEELTGKKYNRYMLVIAASKCARMVTDEYCEQRAVVEKLIDNKQTDKTIAASIKRELRDDKAVKTAINRLYKGSYRINDESLDVEYQAEKQRAEMIEEEKEERALAQRKREEDERRKAQLREFALSHADEQDDDDLDIEYQFELKQRSRRHAKDEDFVDDDVISDMSDSGIEDTSISSDIDSIGGSLSGIDEVIGSDNV